MVRIIPNRYTIEELYTNFTEEIDESRNKGNYGALLREMEDNFDKKCFESSKPIVEYHGYGSQDSNNVETKMNLQACIGKLLPSRCG